jgi:hypothetical protein
VLVDMLDLLALVSGGLSAISVLDLRIKAFVTREAKPCAGNGARKLPDVRCGSGGGRRTPPSPRCSALASGFGSTPSASRGAGFGRE